MPIRKDLLKGGIHACLLFPEGDPFGAAERVLARLNLASTSPLTSTQIGEEIKKVHDRPRGDGLVDAVQKLGFPRHYAGINVAYAKSLGLRPVQLGTVSLCVDVLNLDNELAWDAEWLKNVVEVFVVGGQPSEHLFRNLGEIVQDLRSTFAFAGAGAFTAGFAQLVEREASEVTPAAFLWPMTFLRSSVSGVEAPVASFARFGEYIGVQVEDELFAGHPERYEPVARQLDLRTLWEGAGNQAKPGFNLPPI